MKNLLLIAFLIPLSAYAAPEVFSLAGGRLQVVSPNDETWGGWCEGAVDSSTGLMFTLMRRGKAKLLQIHVRSLDESESRIHWLARREEEIEKSGGTILSREEVVFAGVEALEVRSVATTGSGDSRSISYLFIREALGYSITAVLFSLESWPTDDSELGEILGKLKIEAAQPASQPTPGS